jgi:hypothetical protein
MQTFRFGQPVEILQSDGWHPAIYAICHESWCTHEVLAECDPRSLIEVGNGYIRPLPDEPMPIRRGDVVQLDPTGSLGCRPRTYVVTGVSGDGFVGLDKAPPVPLSFVVRIGRAKYHADGNLVED